MELIYFIFLIFLVIYLPGRFILRLSRFEEKDSVVKNTVIFSSGISSFLLSTFILSYLNLAFMYLFFVLIAVIFELRHSKLRISVNLLNLEVLTLSLGTLAMFYLTARSGLISGNQMAFYSSNGIDYIFHLSLVGNLTHTFPPTHASISGIVFKGYHFFYDFLVANFVSFFKLNIFNSLFRYFPLFISFLYGFSGWAVAKKMKMGKIAMPVFIFLLYFAGGFQVWIFNLLKMTGNYNPGLNPQIINIIDPSVILSIILLFSAFIVLFSEKKNVALSVLFLGIMPQVKIYTAILSYFSLGLVAIINLIREKDRYLFPILIIGGAISAAVYLPINLGAGGLIFAPLLFYSHFMETSTIFSGYAWPFKLQVYDLHHNYLRIVQLYLTSGFLLFAPTLGLRIINFVFVKNLFKKIFYSSSNIFWGTIVVLGFLIPTFFIQSVAVFNIIQFTWISYIVLLIPTAFSIEKIFGKLNPTRALILTLTLVGLSFPALYNVFDSYSTNPKTVDLSLVNAAAEINQIVGSKQNILLLYGNKEGVPLISALTSRSVYLEPQGLDFAGVSDEIKKREEKLTSIEQELSNCSDSASIADNLSSFMKENNISYIFPLEDNKCLKTVKNLSLNKLNGGYVLYKPK